MKTRETGGDRFHRFVENRSIKFEILKAFILGAPRERAKL
jgi:hypothetical protein